MVRLAMFQSGSTSPLGRRPTSSRWAGGYIMDCFFTAPILECWRMVICRSYHAGVWRDITVLLFPACKNQKGPYLLPPQLPRCAHTTQRRRRRRRRMHAGWVGHVHSCRQKAAAHQSQALILKTRRSGQVWARRSELQLAKALGVLRLPNSKTCVMVCFTEAKKCQKGFRLNRLHTYCHVSLMFRHRTIKQGFLLPLKKITNACHNLLMFLKYFSSTNTLLSALQSILAFEMENLPVQLKVKLSDLLRSNVY